MEDNEPMVDENEEGGESSNRMFVILAASLGGLFVVGLICIVAVFFIQRGQAGGSQAVANATIAAGNAATIAAATAAAQPTEVPLPSDTPAPTDTPAPPPTNTPVVVTPAPPTATEAPLPTAAPVTPGKASATPTTAKPTSTSSAASGGTAAASGGVAATGTPEGNISQTGVGGFGLVAVAAALVAVLFIARRVRLVQH
jgi:cytoskeletal protein RodZ